MRLIDAADGEAFNDAFMGALHGNSIVFIKRALVLVDHDAVIAERFKAVTVKTLL